MQIFVFLSPNQEFAMAASSRGKGVRQSCRSLCCCDEERLQNSWARTGGDVCTVFGAYGPHKGPELSSFVLESNAKRADTFLLALSIVCVVSLCLTRGHWVRDGLRLGRPKVLQQRHDQSQANTAAI